MSTSFDVKGQRELLQKHRETLHILLVQHSMFTSAHTPPFVFHGIRDARTHIAAIKATLRTWGEDVDDQPNDTTPTLGEFESPDSFDESEVEFEESKREAIQSSLEVIANGSVSPTQRLGAAVFLAYIGDPRFPTSPDEWRSSLLQVQRTFGVPDGYWCYVTGGNYPIGNWLDFNRYVITSDPKRDTISRAVDWLEDRFTTTRREQTLYLKPFWIGKYHITNQQFAYAVPEIYHANARHLWTPNGWAWSHSPEGQTAIAQHWERTPPDKNKSNAPVLETWFSAMAYCAWLTHVLRDAIPPDYIIRLPTEAEWEAAAAFDTFFQKRQYPWGNTAPTLAHAVYAGLDQALQYGGTISLDSFSVGCCPAGVAACGAFDMGGNAAEWCSSDYRGYPGTAYRLRTDTHYTFTNNVNDYAMPLRGPAWTQIGRSYALQTNARTWGLPWQSRAIDSGCGIRIVLAPKQDMTTGR